MRIIVKPILITIAFILLLFVLTNPSYKDFKAFSQDYDIHTKQLLMLWHEPVHRKLKDYFVYSIYEMKIMVYNDGEVKQSESHTYVGILGNFIEFRQ